MFLPFVGKLPVRLYLGLHGLTALALYDGHARR
jgi:hypothetical protein